MKLFICLMTSGKWVAFKSKKDATEFRQNPDNGVIYTVKVEE